MTAERLRTALARALLAVAVVLLPPAGDRARYREQWQADLDGAAELGLAPLGLAAGMVTTALTAHVTQLRHTAARGLSHRGKGASMPRTLPIGPLALALSVIHGERSQPVAIVLAVILTAALLAGIGLLLAV